MKITRFKFWVFLTAPICVLMAFTAAAFIFLSGCEMFENHTDPVAGWKNFYPNPEPDAAIKKDYEDYMHNLPPWSAQIDAQNFFYEDKTGQHAVKIEVAVNGTWWIHVLIYDQNDKRIKVIKYIGGHYAC
jgi:hypothetical protein